MCPWQDPKAQAADSILAGDDPLALAEPSPGNGDGTSDAAKASADTSRPVVGKDDTPIEPVGEFPFLLPSAHTRPAPHARAHDLPSPHDPIRGHAYVDAAARWLAQALQPCHLFVLSDKHARRSRSDLHSCRGSASHTPPSQTFTFPVMLTAWAANDSRLVSTLAQVCFCTLHSRLVRVPR